MWHWGSNVCLKLKSQSTFWTNITYIYLPAGRRPRGWLRPELPKLPWRKGKARQPGRGPRDLKSGHAPPTEGEGLHLSPGLPAPPWQPLLLVNQVKKIRCSQTSGFPTFLSPPSVFHKKHELLQKLLKSRKPHLCALRKALLSFPVSSLPEPYPQLLRAPAAAAFSPRPPPACCVSWLFVTRGCSISLWSRKVWTLDQTCLLGLGAGSFETRPEMPSYSCVTKHLAHVVSSRKGAWREMSTKQHTLRIWIIRCGLCSDALTSPRQISLTHTWLDKPLWTLQSTPQGRDGWSKGLGLSV